MNDSTLFSILYVDDEPHNLTTFKATFRRKYRIFTAGGGEEGLEILRKEEIPLVISDQRMPGMTGVEFLERVAREFPNTMRIILTGYSDVEAIIRAINRGAIFRYITKPWAETELQMTIENARQVYALQQRNRDLVRELQGRMTTQERTLRLFSRYVPEPVVKKALAKSDDSIFEGELAYVTVLFCDIRGFTSMSEDLPPDTIVRFLNDYYAMMTACVKSHHGSVCQFVGDEVFATFGAPLGTTQNEENAVYCALNMLDEMARLSEKYKEALKREIVVGIGIHAGEVITGNVGSEDRINYAITGRNVNLGRRIELLTKELPNGILISEPVYEQVHERIPSTYWTELNLSEEGTGLTVFRVETQKT
jgi:adenylate cyclase